LLDQLFNEENLLSRLVSIKHYFFLDLGDFFVHFLDASEEILDNTTKNVFIEKLESLLEMAIRTSSANSDPFKDDLTCELNSYTLIEQLFAM
jgi:gamma-tubulin complex component 2